MHKRLGLAIGWTLFILALCTIPGESLPSVNLWEPDKLVHFGLFLVFGLLWLRIETSARATIRVMAGGVAFAFLTEVYQGVMPFERSPDVYDALANLAGLLVALLIHRRLVKRAAPANVPLEEPA